MMKNLLIYNPETGEFHWRDSGRKAGYVDKRGFRKIESQGKVVRAHYLAWEMYYGEPAGEIYHINGDTNDNRISNLDVVKEFENIMDVLRYESETGKLFWKVAPSRKVKIGSEAGCECKTNKHVVVLYRGKQYKAHRIAWELFHGVPPDGEIDHINGKYADNRIENLRVVSRVENARNMKLSKNNKSGYPGVRACSKVEGKWIVTIGDKYLGYFDNFEDAVTTRQVAEEVFEFHVNHGKR